MKNRIKKSASQKIRIKKINNNNLSLDLINQDITNRYHDNSNNIILNYKKKDRYAYKLFQKDNKFVLLCFDSLKKQFNFENFFDFDNFTLNYSESYRARDDKPLNNNSIFYTINNNLYIVTVKNSDLLYKYNNENKKISKICKLNDNHAKGCLLSFENKIFCLSGNHNKKVEIFFEEDKKVINLGEMNVERSNFAACIIQKKYIFALFGFNYPTQQYLDTIEFYELKNIEYYNNNYFNNNNEYGWKYLNYKNNKLLNLSIEGHICFNYNDEKIIFFGGFNGANNNSEEHIYELILNDEQFIDEATNRGVYVDKLDKKLNDIYKNGCYFFGNNNGFIFEENNNLMFTAFDNNSILHILEIDNMIHNVYYFE